MQYRDGSEVVLGDVVTVPVPSGTAKGRVVMLGQTYAHLEIDPSYLSWVLKGRILESSSIVIQWVAENPLAHNDPRFAPVGDYLISPLDEWVRRVD